MPQVFALVMAGAGIYAGIKWFSRLVTEAQEAALRHEQEMRARAQDGVAAAAKDLGQLERDPATGVYRPRSK